MRRILGRECPSSFFVLASFLVSIRLRADHFCSADKTINAEYAIDPVRNGGLEFQYDEVVRAKGERRRMDAGDCECCRDVSLN
jgi:hypothetical protein